MTTDTYQRPAAKDAVSLAVLITSMILITGCGTSGADQHRSATKSAKRDSPTFASEVRECASSFNSEIGTGDSSAGDMWRSEVAAAESAGVHAWAGEALANQGNCLVYVKGLHPKSGVAINVAFTRRKGSGWQDPVPLQCDLSGTCPQMLTARQVEASAQATLTGGLVLTLLSDADFQRDFRAYDMSGKATGPSGNGNGGGGHGDVIQGQSAPAHPPHGHVNVVETDMSSATLLRDETGFDGLAQMCNGLTLPSVTWTFRATDCTDIGARWQAGLQGFECGTYVGADGTPNSIYWCLGSASALRGQYVEAKRIRTTSASDGDASTAPAQPGGSCGTVTGAAPTGSGTAGYTVVVESGDYACGRAASMMQRILTGRAKFVAGQTNADSYFDAGDGWRCPPGRNGTQFCRRGTESIKASTP